MGAVVPAGRPVTLGDGGDVRSGGDHLVRAQRAACRRRFRPAILNCRNAARRSSAAGAVPNSVVRESHRFLATTDSPVRCGLPVCCDPGRSVSAAALMWLRTDAGRAAMFSGTNSPRRRSKCTILRAMPCPSSPFRMPTVVRWMPVSCSRFQWVRPVTSYQMFTADPFGRRAAASRPCVDSPENGRA